MIRSVAIVGAGAMGCLFAARLIEAGTAITLIDVDAARLAALAGDGVTLIDDGGERTVPVDAARAPDITGPVDLVIMLTKGMHTAAAAASVAHLASGGSLALTLQNGLGNAEALAEIFAPTRILIGATDLPADLTGPSQVTSHGMGRIVLGSWSDAPLAARTDVVALLRRAGFDAVDDVGVAAAIWEKVAFNAAMNGMTTVTGLSVGGLDTPAGKRIAAAVVAEVGAVALARSIAFEAYRVHARIGHALAHHRGHQPSMLQDRLAGRRTEVESIHGAIVRAGQAARVPTPVTATLADLIRLIEPM